MTTDDIQKSIVNPTKPKYFDKTRGDNRDELAEKIKDKDMIVLTDGDADGIYSAGIVNYVFNDTLDIGIVPCGVHDSFIYLNDALRVLNENLRENSTVWILDICVNEFEEWKINNLETANKKFNVRYFDHHEWSNEERISYIDQHTSHLELDCLESKSWTVGDTTVDERPTVLMMYQYFKDSGVEFNDELTDRIKATAVGDIWLTDDDNEYIHPLTDTIIYGTKYITNKPRIERFEADWYGYKPLINAFFNTDISIEDSQLHTFAEEQQQSINEKIEYVFERKDTFMTEKTIDGITYTAIYGNLPSTETAKVAKDNGSEAVVILYPSLGAAFRGKENVFEECDTIAEEFGGGGHKMASGCSLEQINPYESVEEYIKDKGQRLQGEIIEKMQSFA